MMADELHWTMKDSGTDAVKSNDSERERDEFKSPTTTTVSQSEPVAVGVDRSGARMSEEVAPKDGVDPGEEWMSCSSMAGANKNSISEAEITEISDLRGEIHRGERAEVNVFVAEEAIRDNVGDNILVREAMWNGASDNVLVGQAMGEHAGDNIFAGVAIQESASEPAKNVEIPFWTEESLIVNTSEGNGSVCGGGAAGAHEKEQETNEFTSEMMGGDQSFAAAWSRGRRFRWQLMVSVCRWSKWGIGQIKCCVDFLL